jgi:hypothetical protein
MTRVAGFVGFLVLATLPAGLAAQTPRDEAVDAGRRALQGSADYPWYDASQDTVQRIDVEPPRDLAGRKSKWQPPNVRWSIPDWFATLLRIMGWTLLGIVFGLLLYALLRATIATTLRPGSSAESDESIQGDVDRIEALPFQLKVPQTDLLAQARHHFDAGEYAQAIVYLYSYQLIQLDRHQQIRLTKGKTNRQYLRELRSRRELWDILFQSMVAFEDVFFGHHTLTRGRFEACWRRLDESHQQLARASA